MGGDHRTIKGSIEKKNFSFKNDDGRWEGWSIDHQRVDRKKKFFNSKMDLRGADGGWEGGSIGPSKVRLKKIFFGCALQGLGGLDGLVYASSILPDT